MNGKKKYFRLCTLAGALGLLAASATCYAWHGGAVDYNGGKYYHGGGYHNGSYYHGNGYYNGGTYYSGGGSGSGVVIGVPIGGYVAPICQSADVYDQTTGQYLLQQSCN